MPIDGRRRGDDHYTILGLSTLGKHSRPSKQDVKLAYHRALLRYHPDKAQKPASVNATTTDRGGVQGETEYTVDQITAAYNILSDPVTRAAYDKERDSLNSGHAMKSNGKVLHTGLETHDLEDLDFDEQANLWYRGCRCGNAQGYVVTETELEKESDEGEIYVACKGCSLWIKVLFSMVEGEEPKVVREERSI